MTDSALPIWREKLAGVTPGPWMVDEACICSPDEAVCQTVRPDEYWGANDDEVPPEVQARIQANAAHIVRSDRLSRILADEATVEGLAKVIAENESLTSFETEARAVLNHLAQLALGDGT